jgi:signal transduction histidine kinase
MSEEQERASRDDGIQVDRFASVVAHDLQNPLNIAEGEVELARGECDSEHLNEVARVHNRMRKLISDLLTFAREEGGVHEREVIDIEMQGRAGGTWPPARRR